VARERRPVALRATAVLAVAAAFAYIALSGAAPSSAELRDFGDDLGAAGPLVWPPLFALVNFVVPWPILAGVTGAVFGTAGGTALALLGILLAAALQFGIARFVPGPGLRARVLERVPRVDRILERNGFLAVLLSRVVPGVSWGMVNYAAGLARVRLREVWAGTVVGGTPKVFAYVALGGSFDDLGRPEAIVAIALLAIVALAGLALARRELAGR
jgi:uncharacterized membrane protein YdjX (TVP38/TMEM64 family)